MPNCEICNKNIPRRTNIYNQMVCAKCALDLKRRREILMHAKNKMNQLNRSAYQRRMELTKKKKQILQKRNTVPVRKPIRFPQVPTHVPVRKPIRFPQVPTHVPVRKPIRFPQVPTHAPKGKPIKFPQVPTHVPIRFPQVPTHVPIRFPEVPKHVPRVAPRASSKDLDQRLRLLRRQQERRR